MLDVSNIYKPSRHLQAPSGESVENIHCLPKSSYFLSSITFSQANYAQNLASKN